MTATRLVITGTWVTETDTPASGRIQFQANDVGFVNGGELVRAGVQGYALDKTGSINVSLIRCPDGYTVTEQINGAYKRSYILPDQVGPVDLRDVIVAPTGVDPAALVAAEAIARQQGDIAEQDAREAQLAAETAARITGDANEASARTAAIAGLSTVYAPIAEVAARIAADTALDTRVDALEAGSEATGVRVLVFDGGTKSSYHGDYWPVGVDLGQFLWEFVFRYDAPGGYVISGGFGGHHPVLIGPQPLLGGNIFTGTTDVILNYGDYTPDVGEWLHLAEGWDGSTIYTWVNGMLVAITKFAGPRQAQSSPTADGGLFLGGSNHSNIRGALFAVRAFEHPAASGTMPNLSAGVVGSAYVPEFLLGAIVGDFASGTIRANSAFDFSAGGFGIPDLGSGYNGSLHPGKVTGHEPDPPPVYEVDRTFPGLTFPTGQTRAPRTPPSVPGGAMIFDSGVGNGIDSIPAFAPYTSPYIRTVLGNTEGGSLGALAWQNVNANRPNVMWGRFDSSIVFTGIGTGATWVIADSSDASVRVDRYNVPGFNITSGADHFTAMQDGDIGLCLRATDDDNLLYVEIMRNAFTLNIARLYSRVAGVTTQIGPDLSLPNYTWTTLRADILSTNFDLYVGSTHVGTITGVTDHLTARGFGLRQNYQACGTAVRWRNFTVFTTPASPPTEPAAPTSIVASAGVASASVGFTPGSNGGSPRNGCRITPFIGSTAQTPQVFSTTATTQTVTGLTNGTAYTFKVEDHNIVGYSPLSAASNSVTPTASPTAPGAPTIGTATAGDTTATANWTAPASDGGSAITGYEVKTYDSSGTLLATNTTGVVLTYTKTGLTDGVAVKFKVAAINAVNTGAQSAFSNTVTPTAPAVGAADDFNRPNGALGTSSSGRVWSESYAYGGLVVVGNKAGESTATSGSASMETGLTDHTETVDFTVSGTNPTEHHFNFRQIDGANYLSFQLYRYDPSGGGTTAIVMKRVAGTWTGISGGAFPTIAGGSHTATVVVSGDSITCKVDGSTIFSISLTSDPDHSLFSTATRAGIGSGRASDLNDGTFDNFLVVP